MGAGRLAWEVVGSGDSARPGAVIAGLCMAAPFARSVFLVMLALGLHTVLVVGFLDMLVLDHVAGLVFGLVLAFVAGFDFALVLVLVLFVERVVHGSRGVCRTVG